MVDSVESQLRYIKSLLLMDEAADLPSAQRAPDAPHTDQGAPYLAEQDEDKIHKAMEEMREELLRSQEASVQADWQRQRDLIHSNEMSF